MKKDTGLSRISRTKFYYQRVNLGPKLQEQHEYRNGERPRNSVVRIFRSRAEPVGLAI